AIVVESGSECVFDVVHLHHHSAEKDETIRQQELAVVMDVVAPHRKAARPHILCGDFNADSPVQQIDPDKCKPNTRQAWKDNGGHLPRRAISDLLSHGYVDTLHAVRGEYAANSGTFTTQFPGQRVDHIFTHGVDPARLGGAWIEYDRLAKYASDHYPIGLEIS